MSFSVLILTLNEEVNLPGCLASIPWADDIVVIDSYSSDQTTEICRRAGLRVVQRKFDSFAGQRNFALDTIAFKYKWVFNLDADEHFTEELRLECLRVVNEDEKSGYFVPSRLMLGNKWLRYSGMYPTFQARLLKIGETRFIQVGHGQREAQSARGFGTLKQPYLHYNFSKGLDDWRQKHVKYADEEAREGLAKMVPDSADRVGVFSFGDAVGRRRALKHLSARLPFRSLLRFIYMYFLRLGILDGAAGLKYCRMMAWYEGRIARRTRELAEEVRRSHPFK